jgi:hypothetical protein
MPRTSKNLPTCSHGAKAKQTPKTPVKRKGNNQTPLRRKERAAASPVMRDSPWLVARPFPEGVV